MTLFVDASALVAILLQEPDGEDLLKIARDSGDVIWSAMSCWETVLAVSTRRGLSFAVARDDVEAFAVALPLELVDIGERERRLALDAHETYGKGRHDARLNMGDCFAYACAKTNGASLLYKGDDFAKTDLA